jgi:putative ubiquitin-RnfH superfamily antitoxin RatB of RatAB toxin-antitoxin module
MATKARRKKVTKSDFIPNGVTPFDTGKVKMGIYYQKPMYVEYDSDMLEIQKWMIGDPVKLRREYWINTAYILALVFVLLVIILKGT